MVRTRAERQQARAKRKGARQEARQEKKTTRREARSDLKNASSPAEKARIRAERQRDIRKANVERREKIKATRRRNDSGEETMTLPVPVKVQHGKVKDAFFTFDLERDLGNLSTDQRDEILELTETVLQTIGDVLDVLMKLTIVGKGNDIQPFGGSAAGAATGFAKSIMKLVDVVREANTTTILVVNAVPDSTLKLREGETSGKWLDVVPGGESITCDEEFAGALVCHCHPFRSHALTKGDMQGFLELPDGSVDQLNFSWFNPLGPNQDKSDHVARHVSGPGLVTATAHLGAPDGKTRRDIVLYLVTPSQKWMQNRMARLSTQANVRGML